MRLLVAAEVDGSPRDVGLIETFPGSGERFTYDPCWVEEMPRAPLSLSLPVRREPYCAKEMRPYFEGLLPEGDARKAASRALGVSGNSYLKLLYRLARECIGAVSVSEEGDCARYDLPLYQPLSDADLAELALGGYSRSSDLAVESRLSIAGAQAKTGLYHLGGTEGWYVPQGSAPSTHVVKPASPAFERLAQNERWCMRLAALCGVAVAQTADVTGHPDLFAVVRFDRSLPEGPRLVSGLPVPRRLHQEDFCQALGVLVGDKYEERGERHLASMFSVIERYVDDPISDRNRLVDLVAFNCFIGNCDAHLKNYGLLRSESWGSLGLAPAYDLVSTTVYPDLTRRLGMAVGQARTIDSVRLSSFEELAEEVSMSPKMVARRVRDLGERVLTALDSQMPNDDFEEACASQTAQRIRTILRG